MSHAAQSNFDYKQYTSTYDSIPQRIIKSIDQPPKRSYGLIVYASETGKWLLIREKYSPFFSLIMRGLYRESSLPLLFDGMTSTEIDLLKILCSDYDRLLSLYNKMFTNKKELFSPTYTYSRLQSPIVKTLLHNGRTNPKEYWSIPSGKPMYNEDSLSCAIRECYEETGIKIDFDKCVMGNSITENILLFSGGLLCKTYWPVTLPNESKLPNISTLQNEVEEARWVTNEDAKLILSTSKYQLLQSVLCNKSRSENNKTS